MEEIRLYHRPTSPFIQAEITVAPEYKIRVSTKTTCENEAQRFAYKKYIEAKTRYDLGIRDEHTTFGQAYSKWEKRSLRTIHNTYMQWIAPRWGREPLSKITSVQLQKWFDEMALGSSRKGDIARIVRGVFEKAVQIKILSKAPSFKIVADPENPRPHFTDEEVRQVLDRLPGWCEGKKPLRLWSWVPCGPVGTPHPTGVPSRPFFIGRPGCVRSKAWICDFSSIDSITACSGGFT